MAYKNLTWKDIRLIINFADTVLDSMDKKELLTFGQENYYNEVLERVSQYIEKESCKANVI